MLKEKFIAYKIKRLLKKQSNNNHLNASFDRAVKIGVIFSLADKSKSDVIHQFVKKLKAEGKKVELLSFKKSVKTDDPSFHDYFSPADFGFWGGAKNEQLIRFCENKFDFLFCLDEHLSLYVKYVLAASPAKCRIGYLNESTIDFFEMQFKPKDKTGTAGLTEEILYYVKKLTHHESKI